MNVSEITEHLRAKIIALKPALNTYEHNLYVGIHNQYNYTLMLIDLVNNSPETPRQMLLQLLSDCSVTHFVRIFSHVEFNVKKLMLVTQDSSLTSMRNSISEHKKPVYLYDILSRLDKILNNEPAIKNLKKLNHIRNIIVHNNEIAYTTCTYNFGKNYGSITLKKNKRIVLSSTDLLIRLADLLLSSYVSLSLALIARNIIDIDVINQTKW